MSKLKERRREIQGMDLVAAQEELKMLRRQLFDLRIQKERGEVKDTRQFAKTKNDIARVLYHIGELHHEAEMEAEEMESGAPGVAQPEATAAAPTTSAPTTSAPTTGKARAARASTVPTPAPAGRTATSAAAPVTEATATSAGTTAGTTAGTSATSVPLTATEPTEALSTPELPAPSGGSEDQER